MTDAESTKRKADRARKDSEKKGVTPSTAAPDRNVAERQPVKIVDVSQP